MTHPIPFETLVAYWAHELPPDEEEALELHVFGCAECAAASEGIAAITTTMRALLPPIVARERIAKLRESGVRVVENVLAPGDRKPVTFGDDVDILLHRLGGLDLANAERVDVFISDDDTGAIIGAQPGAPFDRDAGEVLVACQRHFAAFPPNVRFDVAATSREGAVTHATYVVPHTFLLSTS